ncbi:hypothetical protein [Sorangium sp. So ce363]|uniref:hypothetical protein n=1 Tax=Sorangium sp. So ce363 TaxID=3133304 RepID=UPI003F6449D3
MTIGGEESGAHQQDNDLGRLDLRARFRRRCSPRSDAVVVPDRDRPAALDRPQVDHELGA